MSENVEFKNELFLRALLQKDSTIDSNSDHLIQKKEAEKVTELDLRSCKIQNVQDVVNFPNLRKLYLNSNEIKSLILENFQFLEEIYCVDNKLTKLILKNLPNLKQLSCGNNQLKSVELVNVPKIESLYLFNNKINEIDLASFTELKYLHLEDNALPKIDISKNLNLIQFNIANNKIQEIDITKNINLDLTINYLDKETKVIGTDEQMKTFKRGQVLTQSKSNYK